VADWERVAGEFAMFSELKKKVERYSADDKLAMQQRAIDEARVAQALEMGGALRRGREEGRAEGREEGREEGRADERVAIARRMAGEGLEKDFICRVLKVTPEELERMLA
jgi:flagellar biosynthesis/type III secretory pathway protein FliH